MGNPFSRDATGSVTVPGGAGARGPLPGSPGGSARAHGRVYDSEPDSPGARPRGPLRGPVPQHDYQALRLA
jgi:hypothetical protein